MRTLLSVTLLGLISLASCNPLVYGNGYPYYTSAAIVAPPAQYVPAVAPAVAPTVAPVAAFAPGYPYSSVQAYSYSIQDYLAAAPAPAALTYEYALPYAYAADWFYRR